MSKSFAPHSLNTVATYISRYQLVLNEVLATKWRTGTWFFRVPRYTFVHNHPDIDASVNVIYWQYAFCTLHEF